MLLWFSITKHVTGLLLTEHGDKGPNYAGHGEGVGGEESREVVPFLTLVLCHHWPLHALGQTRGPLQGTLPPVVTH